MKKAVFLFVISRIFAIFFMSAILSDTHYYVILAQKMFHGAVPYIDFPFEYPPFAIFPIYLSGVISLESYRLWFMLLAVVFDFMIFWEVKKQSRDVFFYTILSSFCLPFLLERLDVFMIFPMVMALACYQRNNFNQGIIWSTVGGWLKLIPFITYIGTFRDKQTFSRTQVKIILLNLFVLTIFSMSFYSNMFDFLKYHTNRPFQVESVISSIVLIGSALTGTPAQIVNNFGSQNLLFPGMETLLKISTFLTLGSFGWLIYFYNKHKDRLNLYDVVSVFIFFLLIFSKVLSDQFFIWPLAFLFLGTLISRMKLLDKVLLTFIYLMTCLLFINYWNVIGKGGIWHWLLFLKNISLIYITVKSIKILINQSRIQSEDSL